MSIHQFNVFESCFPPFRVMLRLINVPGGFYRLYGTIAMDFDSLNRSFVATHTLKI